MLIILFTILNIVYAEGQSGDKSFPHRLGAPHPEADFCTTEYEKIEKIKYCKSKEESFKKIKKECLGQHLDVLKFGPKVFDNLFFNIANCYKDNGDTKSYARILKYALKHEDWHINTSEGNSAHNSIKALLESLQLKSNDVCVSSAEFKRRLLEFIKTTHLKSLFEISNTPLEIGILNSGFSEGITRTQLKSSLKEWSKISAPTYIGIKKNDLRESKTFECHLVKWDKASPYKVYGFCGTNHNDCMKWESFLADGTTLRK